MKVAWNHGNQCVHYSSSRVIGTNYCVKCVHSTASYYRHFFTTYSYKGVLFIFVNSAAATTNN